MRGPGFYIEEYINNETKSANERYGPFTSAHEGYGVLLEEVTELGEAIRLNDRAAVEKEACQVAAVATRLAVSMRVEKTRARSGME